jgi:CheY-like chemotaxis protein
METGTPTVLLLDDEPTVRETGRRFLSLCGYQCLEAESVERAAEMLSCTRVDAAILDLRLPGQKSGLDLLTSFRQQSEFAKIPVLIMTGSILSEAEEAAITKQHAFLFYKPEGFDTIVKFLDQLTGRDQSN